MSPHHSDQMFKGDKSLGSLCSVVKTLIVRQGHLLSCSGQLKTEVLLLRGVKVKGW